MKKIILTKGYEALIDDEDFILVSKHKWHASETTCGFEARAYNPEKGGSPIRMHQLIMGDAPEDSEVDHKDRNKLNNQKMNLRFATRSQNLANTLPRKGTSKYKGVHWLARNKKWQAGIRVNKRAIYLGSFVSEEDAARAYDKAALEHFGEFARLNFA